MKLTKIIVTGMLIPLVLAGQAAEPKPAEQAKPAAEEAKPEEAKAEAPLVEDTEGPVKGSVEIGVRAVSDVGGNFNAYRSVVDLGEGVRLMNLDLDFVNGSKKFFDRLQLRGNGWGGDPYNTAQLFADSAGKYRLTVDYRRMLYLNYLPSFANPNILQGGLVNQRAMDVGRRYSNVQLDLLPGKRVTPYFNWSHDSGSGTGITGFVADANEYPVWNDLSDRTHRFAGGVRLEWGRWNATLEQGGTTFQDDQKVFFNGDNLGNRQTPILGQTLKVRQLLQQYNVNGDSIFSRGTINASPTDWFDVNAQFLFSQPTSDSSFTDTAQGRFILLNQVLFYDRQGNSVASYAKQPHSSGGAGFELRPHRRIRIRESYMTDRLHNASRAQLVEQIALTGAQSFTDRLEMTYNQQQVEALFDVGTKLTFRGGHRYVWGESTVRAPLVQRPAALESAELKRHSLLAGMRFRPFSKVTANVDAEVADGDRTYFRTGMLDYTKVTARVRYQILSNLLVSGLFSTLDNENPDPRIQYNFKSRELAATVQWTPAKLVTVLADYSRNWLRSDISYLAPFTLTAERSLYTDYAHIGSAFVELKLGRPQVSVGGTYFVSAGSRPTRYYQPAGRLAVPLHGRVAWTSEWRWYGMAEPFYTYEGFRAHTFATGLRFTR